MKKQIFKIIKTNFLLSWQWFFIKDIFKTSNIIKDVFSLPHVTPHGKENHPIIFKLQNDTLYYTNESTLHLNKESPFLFKELYKIEITNTNITKYFSLVRHGRTQILPEEKKRLFLTSIKQNEKNEQTFPVTENLKKRLTDSVFFYNHEKINLIKETNFYKFLAKPTNLYVSPDAICLHAALLTENTSKEFILTALELTKKFYNKIIYLPDRGQCNNNIWLLGIWNKFWN
jgi:hypothetical protein